MIKISNLISAISGIIIPSALFLFSYKIFWPKFKKQKRIENLCLSAKEALLILEELKFQVRKLITLKNEIVKDPSKINDCPAANRDTLNIIYKLKTSLLLISKDENLQNNNQVKDLTETLNELDKVLNHKYLLDSYNIIDTLSELGLLDNDNLEKAKFFKNLSETLLSIYQISQADKTLKIKDKWINAFFIFHIGIYISGGLDQIFGSYLDSCTRYYSSYASIEVLLWLLIYPIFNILIAYLAYYSIIIKNKKSFLLILMGLLACFSLYFLYSFFLYSLYWNNSCLFCPYGIMMWQIFVFYLSIYYIFHCYKLKKLFKK